MVKSSYCKIETDVNYAKDDLSELPVVSQDECCKACLKTNGCKAWAFIVKSNYCFLKSADPKPEHRRDFPGINYGTIAFQ